MTSSSDKVYFILTRKPEYPRHVNAGQICYMSKYKHRSQLRICQSPKKLPVCFMSSISGLDYDIDVGNMAELSEKEADFLVALPDDAERLKWYREEAALQTALTLAKDTEVTVEEDGQRLNGIIRYIGKIKSAPYYNSPLSGMSFGIELQGEDRGKGKNDGTYDYKRLFSCEKDCGVIAPFYRVRPVEHRSSSPADLKPQTQAESKADPQADPQQLNPADRVSYFTGGKKLRHGMVLEVMKGKGEDYVLISTDQDESGKTGGEVEVPLKDVIKGEVPTAPESMVVDTPMVEPSNDDLDLSLSSLVEVTFAKGNSYGIIRWIGSLPNRKETMAGLELEDESGVSDGTLKDKRFFDCPPRRALFVKLSSCRPDSRFMNRSEDFSEKMEVQEDTGPEMEHYTGKPMTVPPISSEQIDNVLIGRMKGIQGHCNSCYMDAALFSLFSCSSVLDSMLFKSTTPQDAPIQRTLLYNIVNPLRSKGFVEGRHIMKLRQQLQKHGYSHSFTTDEKDPEEFLTVIMHHILALDPLLKLSAGGKVQESFCYQIFLDQNQLVLPTVQQLLEHSFHCAGLKLAEVPSCLILQMPRFGKKFKMFDKIVPSLELDITDLLSEGPQQCMLCGELAERECIDCFGDPVFSQKGFKVFCGTCSAKVHSHPKRQSHKPVALDVPKGYHGRSLNQTLTRDKLELFAVLCIETSHYVSFIKHGPKSEDWIFFDSMADRQGEIDGFNIPEVRACPEVGAYLEMSPAELANQVPRDMKGVAKRLFCDAYMYLYQSKNMCLYR